jgi:hypothetical protein
MTTADSIAVQAMIQGLERRAAAGEWGAPGSGPLAPPAPATDDIGYAGRLCPTCGGEGDLPDGSGTCGRCKGAGVVDERIAPENPLEAPVSADPPVSAPMVQEVPPAPVAVPVVEDPAGRVAADMRAYVDSLSNAEVADLLVTFDQPTTGRIPALRGRLEVYLLNEQIKAKWAAEAEVTGS